jgi:CHAD domain-containing protein
MRLDPEILDGPAEVGARIVALARLADAEEALGRIADPSDAEALHDFRVALRRLRSALRAFGPLLGEAGREVHRERLRDVQQRTGPARDAEVLARWLEGARGELAAPYRGALDWLLDRAERRRRRAAEEAAREALPRFQRRAGRLERELAVRPAGGRAGPATFAAALVGILRPQTRALRDAVLAVAGPGDAAGIHGARIEAKRLRYVLEPLRGAGVGAEAAVDLLRQLQDHLGDWHDAHAAEASLDGALLEARAEEARRDEAAGAVAGVRPGLLALLQLARRRREALWARVAEQLAAKATPVTDAAYAVVAALEGGDAPEEEGATAAPTPERRFLVTAVPPEAQGGDAEQLDQGWLPGDDRESVGATRSSAGERWFRARAPARGRPGRVEPLTRAEFDAYWPLTDGRRVSKRRRVVPSAPGWHFDEYLDRPLVLAVAEEGQAGPPPEWLEPVLVREVSAERAYLDEALARRPSRRAG